MADRSGPLSGIKIIELAGIGPAPYTCMMLADAGAQDVLLILEVIPAFEADDRQVVDELRASVQVWTRALSDRGLR